MNMGMVEVILGFFISLYRGLLSVLPESTHSALSVFLFGILIALISLFVFYFYRSFSKKDLIVLNLNQYNRYEHPVIGKVLAVVLYFLEYMVIIPFLIFIWFGALSIVLLLVAEESAVPQILILTASLVVAVRILAYFADEISKDLAKLFPFIALSIFLLRPGSLNFGGVTLRLQELPLLFNEILSYILLIFVLEIILRTIYLLVQVNKSFRDSETN